MENEIRKLIEKYDTYIAEEENVGIKARISCEICRGLECLLEFKQKNCCEQNELHISLTGIDDRVAFRGEVEALVIKHTERYRKSRYKLMGVEMPTIHDTIYHPGEK